MASNDFKALLLTESDGKVSAALETMQASALPEGDVLIAVEFSSLNYKDGMIVNGLGKLVRRYPHVPGIDLAGRVIESRHPDWRVDDLVVLTGWHVGERHWGGYAQLARVKGEWLVPLPHGLSTRQAMAIGTAGFTAMLAVEALERAGVTPPVGDVLVTGAVGGVGSVATMLLKQLGYRVVAATGRMAEAGYLKSLGAAEVVARSEFDGGPKRPLDSERWAGCIDSVGGATLATVLSQMKHRGAISACGLAGGAEFKSTVLPFLLRAVQLIGIDSVTQPLARRWITWDRLCAALDLGVLDSLTTVRPLSAVPEAASEILAGKVRGRVVIDVNG